VPWESATRFCDGAPVPIDADHLSIVKPDRAGHDAMVVLTNALDDFVLGKNVAAKLETPDFVPEGSSSKALPSSPGTRVEVAAVRPCSSAFIAARRLPPGASGHRCGARPRRG
jgi:hypothetical protein